MVQTAASVMNTFVHVGVDSSDLVEMGSTARRRASSTPARRKLDAAEDNRYKAHAFLMHDLDEFPLLPHVDVDYTSMYAHPGPSPLDMDVEGMLGYSALESDFDDQLLGLSFSQQEETTFDFANAGIDIDDTLREEIEDYSASARAHQGLMYGAQVPNGNYREHLEQDLSYCAARISLHEPAQRQLSSTYSIPPRERFRDSYMQSNSSNSRARVLHNAPKEDAHSEEEPTTVMLMNVPRGYTGSKLMRTLDSEGFACAYDFIYVPMAAARSAKGYAFVNFVDPSIAQRFVSAFSGFSRWSTASKSVCHAVWAEKHQGLQANIDHYRNSSVLGKSVPDEYKPRLFHNGFEVPFPPRIRKPSMAALRVVQPRGN